MGSDVKIDYESKLLISEFEDQKNIVTFLINNVQKKQALLDGKKVKCSFIVGS
jgi:hypothetical protein